jgi:hypothetical protein
MLEKVLKAKLGKVLEAQQGKVLKSVWGTTGHSSKMF